MLQVARLAPKLLGEAAELVEGFIRRQQNDNGGFRDRKGASDLYYTVFGLDSLVALQAQPDFDRVENWLKSFGAGEGLDFVHLCCLARAWSAMPDLNRFPADRRAELIERLESFRATDGGFHPQPGRPHGTAYGAFLALGAFQDLKQDLPDPLRLVQSLKFLETRDRAWANERPEGFPDNEALAAGSTNATAAAISVLRNLQVPVARETGQWLLERLHREGGFCAAPGTPMPDLLSTATALHAISGLQLPIEPLREPCLDFIDTLWVNEGSFHGNWTDETLDVEYTFYGLLALGHLS